VVFLAQGFALCLQDVEALARLTLSDRLIAPLFDPAARLTTLAFALCGSALGLLRTMVRLLAPRALAPNRPLAPFTGLFLAPLNPLIGLLGRAFGLRAQLGAALAFTSCLLAGLGVRAESGVAQNQRDQRPDGRVGTVKCELGSRARASAVAW
jgi:hypothetical protein